MLGINHILNYYRRPDIQKAMVGGCTDKEVAVRFGDGGFGKRPDTLQFPSDVWELAKQGATSFHVSEETWKNPLQLEVGLRRQDLDTLRKGWDLVLDIDCPDWSMAKLTAWLLVKALQEHHITSISAKFSGNKGFHIGVPFEAFPERFQGKLTAELFPDAARAIAAYLVDYVCRKHIAVNDARIVFGKKYSISLDTLLIKTGKKQEELLKRQCRGCGSIIEQKAALIVEFVCASCDSRMALGENTPYCQCPACGKLMERIEGKAGVCWCGSSETDEIFHHAALIEVDTILISPRHLYRSAYSLHEKSGLVSMPIPFRSILQFKKEMAAPDKVSAAAVFLDRGAVPANEASFLLSMAYDYAAVKKQLEEPAGLKAGAGGHARDFEKFEKALPVELFPPCMHNILRGLKDGKKRGMFLLVNFLSSVGWDADSIEKLLQEWNERNHEPLREVAIQSKIRYHRAQNKAAMPPNCDNQMYYVGIGVCTPDGLCSKIKNPVQYARRKVFFLQRQEMEGKARRGSGKNQADGENRSKEQPGQEV